MKYIWWILGLGAVVALFFIFAGDPGDQDQDPTPEAQTVQVYFNQTVDNEIEQVAVEREVEASDEDAVLVDRALEELLAGPTTEEEEDGLTTEINEGVSVNSVELDDGMAMVDFSAELDEDVAGSARVQAIRNQISMTVTQFDGVDEVEISVEGESEEILQP